MLPHDGSGGWMPRPRNESEASARIAKPMLKEACTTIGVTEFGRTWRCMIHQSAAPSTRAAWTYSRVRTVRTCRKRQHRVDQPHQHSVDGAAPVAGGQTDRAADQDGHRH